MGYMFAVGSCLACKSMMTFNPEKVPSLKGEPICKNCMERANIKRKEMGMEPHFIHPDAYAPEECY
jgi:hypothetical protein